jgi:hypothetical protein
VSDVPIEGQVQLLAAAKASIAPHRLPDLLAAVQADLAPRLADYRRRYEQLSRTDGTHVFFAPADHWSAVGDRLGFDRRETAAVRRAHEAQLRRIGRRADRREEFERALEIRTAVLIGEASDADPWTDETTDRE